MKFVSVICFALVAVLATAVYGLSEACQYVSRNGYLNDTKKIQECWNSFEVSQGFIDTLVEGLEFIGGIYPYVDIARHPPNPSYDSKYFNTVDYHKEVEKIRTALNKEGSDKTMKNVLRSAQKFINLFRDSRFSLAITDGVNNTCFPHVSFAIPFKWDLSNSGGGKPSVVISTNNNSYVFLGDEIAKEIEKRSNKPVTFVDGDKDPYDFFTTMLDDYNRMTSPHGRFVYSKYYMDNGVAICSAPLDDDILFAEHNLTIGDGDDTYTFSFNFTFWNHVFNSRRNIEQEVSSRDEQLDIERVLKTFRPRIDVERDVSENKYLKCNTSKEMNYIIVESFHPSIYEDWMNEAFACVAKFDQNAYPISVILSMNNDGDLFLVQLLFMLLMPNNDFRFAFACRKSDVMKFLAIDYEIFATFSVIDRGCAEAQCSDTEINDCAILYSPNATDIFAKGYEHNRSSKLFVAHKELCLTYFNYSLKNHIRKPTDILIATDGFVTSSASLFISSAIHQGSAIVTGFGSHLENDENFVASQGASVSYEAPLTFESIPGLGELCNKLQANGLQFRVPVFESYTISKDMDEIVPNDYEILRIDKHMSYNKLFDYDVNEMIPYLKAVHKEFNQNKKCNPSNKRLLFVDGCSINDCYALTTGRPCKADGTWDKSRCLISTCKPGYTVDFDNNRCVPNICDVRPEETTSSICNPSVVSTISTLSASSSVYPMIGMIFIAILAFFSY